MGGKTRIAKQIAAVIDQHRKPGQLVWDAFCGGLSVSVALSKKGPVLASDACLPLISLYRAVQEGWDPPTEVSKETWQAAKLLPDTDPMKAFCGFGCSYGGVWFKGYARGNRPDHQKGYAAGSRRVLLRDSNCCKFEHIDFLDHVPSYTDSIIYLDPPYQGVSGYPTGKFDHSLFFCRATQWSKFTDVFISEYDSPVGNVVWSTSSKTKTAGGRRGTYKVTATERLYHIPKGSLT